MSNTIEYTRCNTNSDISPIGLVDITTKVSQSCEDFDEKAAVEEFRVYRERLGLKVILMKNRVIPSRGLLLKPCESSRYFESGRKKAKRNILTRFDKYYYAPGTFLTGTYDPKCFARWEAWGRVRADWRRLKHAIDVRYRRMGRKPPKYIMVIEEQKGTGYPHIHVFYPNLRYLLDKNILQELWNVGRTRVQYSDRVNVGSYICKYVIKLSGWSDEALAFIWKKRIRMYSYSRCYNLVNQPKKRGEWSYTYNSMNKRVISRSIEVMRSIQEVLDPIRYLETPEKHSKN